MPAMQQARLFGAMAAGGAALGAVYDVLRAFRRLCRGGRTMESALDLIFGLLAAADMIAVGLVMREDPFRLFAFAGIACGFTIYGVSLGTIVRYLSRRI